MRRSPLSTVCGALVLLLGAGLARAESGLSDLEMDVMESGETPARAMSRIALPVNPAIAREPAIEAEARADTLPRGEEMLFRSAADARIEVSTERPDPPPPIEGSD